MSGPKSSSYTLTPEQRRILLEQLRKAEEERIEREKLHLTIEQNSRRIGDYIEKLQYISKRYCELGLQSEQIKQAYETVNTVIAQAQNCILNVNRTEGIVNLDALKKTNEKIEAEKIKLGNIIAEQSKKQKEFESLLDNEIVSKLSAGFSICFKNIEKTRDAKKSEERQKILDKIQVALDELSEMILPDNLKKKFETIQQNALQINSAEYLNNFYAISVEPYLKECREYSEAYELHYEEYLKLKAQYKVLADEELLAFEEVPFSLDAITILKGRISDIENVKIEKKQREYINKCIDEVMTEMGYDLVGTRTKTKKNGKKFKSELYQFDVGTGVNVTYQENGQIVMELGGLDTQNRVPSEAENARLTEDMEEFCTKYREMEPLLEQRGVTVRHISLLPPEPAYAQIIDVSDYELSQEIISIDEAETEKTKKGKTTRVLLHQGE